MRCRDVRARMSDYLDEALGAREAQAVAEHLQTCASCAAEWTSLSAAVQAVRTLPRLRSSGSIAFRVLSQLEVQSRGPGLALLFRPAWRARPLIFPSLVSAALVLASVLAGVAALNQEPKGVLELPAATTQARWAPYGTEANPLFLSSGVTTPRVRARSDTEQVALAGWPGDSLFFETVIGRDGSVADVKLLNGTSDHARAVADALRGERFEPARLRGRPVAVSVYRLISHMEVRATVT
jgi:anti-sigma factor RsiW